MSKNAVAKRDRSIIIVIACLILVAIFWVLPPVEPLTQIGMRVIGVFIATVIMLSFVDPVWPSMISIALLSRTGVATLSEITSASVGNWIFYFILLSFIMTYALNECGFMDRLVGRFMRFKFATKSPWAFTISMSLITLIIAGFIDQVPAIAFALTFANKVYEELGYTKEDSYPHMVTPLVNTLSPTMVVLIITTCGVFLTNFASNVTTITVMTGVGVAIALGSGGLINPAGISLCTTMAGSCAYLLPSSFAGIALLHGDPYSDRNTILKYGFVMMLVSSVAIGLVGYVVGCALTV